MKNEKKKEKIEIKSENNKKQTKKTRMKFIFKNEFTFYKTKAKRLKLNKITMKHSEI